MYVASSRYMLVQYILYIYTHRSEEAKRKQSEQRRLQRKRSQKILDENAAYGPPDKGNYFDNEIITGQKKRKSCSAKKLPLQSKQQNEQEKTPTVGATVKAKYDREWFIGGTSGLQQRN